MKILWILSALIGFTLTEKLDRIYLPPPGSKFSGGSPGDIDVPLELPKERNSSNSQENNFGRPEIANGIEGVGSNISPEKYGAVTSTEPSFHGNSYGLPTTSTSYAFSQTTSYVPALDLTIGSDISMSSKYPFNNPTSDDFIEKNRSFDHTRPNNVYNAVEEKQMLNDINNILENQLPDNIINSQVLEELSNENVRSNNGDDNNIPNINSHFNGMGNPGITSTTSEIDHSLLNNHYNTYHRPPLSEPINEQDVILISSTPRPLDNISSITPTQYVSTSPPISNIPYAYHRRPDNIQAQDREAVILNYDNTITPDSYAYSFDTSNEIHADEKGIAINGVRAVGSYSYIGDDGQLYSVNYTADENRFRPHGTHLPTAPPIPDAILKVIEQAEIDKANGIYDDGSYDENKYGYRKYNPTKNIRFFNQYNKDRESTKLNRGKSYNQLSQSTRLDENLNNSNNTDQHTQKQKNEQKIIAKTKVQPFTKNELLNEIVPEISDHYKPEQFVNIGNDHIDSSNNDYNKNVRNEKFSSKPNLKDIEKEDRRMGTEFYDETGYHYSKPQNDYSLKVANKLINRFPETQASVKIPGMYKKIVEHISNPFMTLFVPRNYNIEQDSDEQSFDIPAKFQEEENVILSNQNSNPFPTLAETNKVPGKTENKIIHNFNNQFKPDILLSANAGYLYGNVKSNNDSYVPFITATEIGLSDMTPTISTVVPTRFNEIESRKDTNSKIPSKYSKSSLFQNQTALLNPTLDQDNYVGPLTHSKKLDIYGNNNNGDITDAGPRYEYNIPNKYGTNRDYIIDQSTPKTHSENFSGPKQPQKYDSLSGYHY